MYKKVLTSLLAFTLMTIATLPACECYEEHAENEECSCECHSVAPANERHWLEG